MKNRYILLATIFTMLLHLPLSTFAESPADDLLASGSRALERGDKDAALKLADKAVEADPKNVMAYEFRASVRDARREFDKAVADYGKVIDLSPGLAVAYQRRGEDQFRIGHFKESVADFDKVIELNPGHAPHHWQRGISLYYAGEFDRGAKQFELHKTVNPEDVENAVWHFLCVARLSGVEKARQSLIPIHDDGRVPMMQVYALFGGKATQQTVMDAVNAGDPAKGVLKERLFYAHLYLGLYDEATGKLDSAKEHIRLAAETYADDDYMGDVARVHLMVLKKAAGAADPAHPRAQAEQDGSAADVAARAKDVLELLEARRANGEAPTPAFVEMYCSWSRRLALAQRNAASTQAGKVAALEAYAKRLTEESKVLANDAGPESTRIQPAQLEYFQAEARMLLAQARKAADAESHAQKQPSATHADMAAKARIVVESLEDRRANGEALTPAFVELYFTWLRRLALAERDAASTKTEKVAALNTYLSRVREMTKTLEGFSEFRPGQVRVQGAMAAFYVAEAEAMLAAAKQ